MTEEVYNARKGLRRSELWEMRKTPSHFQYHINNPEKDTDALRIGRAVHMAILQPKMFKKAFVAPSESWGDLRTKEGKEKKAAFLASVPEGAEVLTFSEMEQVKAMQHAVRTKCIDLLRDTQREYSVFWKDPATGIDCKARFDAWKPGTIIDIKTAEKADTDHFIRASLEYGYHLQAAFYRAGAIYAKQDMDPDFIFIVIEKNPPYAVHVMKAGDSFIITGETLMQDLMFKLKECQESKSWPDYETDELNPIGGRWAL